MLPVPLHAVSSSTFAVMAGEYKKFVTSDFMTTANIIRELEQLPLTDRLLVIERTLRSIRTEKEKNLKHAVDSLYNDYKTDKELTVFTQLDNEPFYETR